MTDSPLQAQALALVLAAKIAHILQLKQVLTDCLPLAKAVASRRLDSNDVHWTTTVAETGGPAGALTPPNISDLILICLCIIHI